VAKVITCRVLHTAEHPGALMHVYLAQPKKPFRYRAGQYVDILVDGEAPRPFSIANAFDQDIIEFHIRHVAQNSYAQKLVQQIKHDKTLSFQGPYGNMQYQKKPRYPLIFIAAGTGIAPCKAIMEEAARDKNPPEVYLYQVTRKILEKTCDKILKNHPHLSKYHIYASGPQEMVFTVQKKLGHPKYFYSDWLTYGVNV